MSTTISSNRESRTNGAQDVPRPLDRAAKGTTARRSARNRSRVLVGTLLVLVSAFAAAVLYSSAGERHPVLAVARPVAAGQVIQPDDLHEVLVAADASVQTIPAGERSQVIGRTAAVPLAAGSLLARTQLGDSSLADPSQAVVGAVLKEGRFPDELRSGDAVLLYVLPGGTGDQEASEGVRANVIGLSEAHAPGAVSLTLATAPGDAGTVATAAAQDRLIVVLAPR